MSITSRLVRFAGAVLASIGVLLSSSLYVWAPWSLDITAFLIRPLLLFALPIFIAGVSMIVRPQEAQRNMFCPVIVGVTGLIGIFALDDWPSKMSLYFWEDSYQNLAILEAAYGLLSIPFLICCFITVCDSLPKRAK